MADTNNTNAGFMRRALGVFGYSRRAIDLVWTTSRPLTVTLALLTIVGGILPAVIAYIGQLIVDGVVTAAQSATPDTRGVLSLVGLEALVVIAVAATQRGISASQSLLRGLLGQRVNVMAVAVPPLMRTPEALAVFGPKAFGFDHPFTPIEQLG